MTAFQILYFFNKEYVSYILNMYNN